MDGEQHHTMSFSITMSYGSASVELSVKSGIQAPSEVLAELAERVRQFSQQVERAPWTSRRFSVLTTYDAEAAGGPTLAELLDGFLVADEEPGENGDD